MAEHLCVDCKAEDPDGMRGHVRPTVPHAKTPRCETHFRAHVLGQKKQARARQVERTYGISAEDSHELLLFQGGTCWLCREATGAAKSLAVDHDHRTGDVRGRLCGPCNQFIGRLGDDPATAQRLVGYLSGDTPYRRLLAKRYLEQRGIPVPVEMVGLRRAADGSTWATFKAGDDVNPGPSWPIPDSAWNRT